MNVLDLFSGIGGFSLGLERAGMRTVAFCEIDPYCRAVLAKHWPGVPVFGDICSLGAESLAGLGPIDIVCGGFPCQDASMASEHRTGTSGERTGLYREMVRAIGLVGPQHAIMENVAGLLDTGMGDVLGELAEGGHDAEWDCVSASDVGAPHERERLWIVTDPTSVGLQGPREYFKSIDPASGAFEEANSLVLSFQGNALPYVCGRHDGLPKRVAEPGLHALGNTIVPAIPELIGRAIMRAAA